MSTLVLVLGIVVLVELALGVAALLEVIGRERELERLLTISGADPLSGLLYPDAYAQALDEECRRVAFAGGDEVRELLLPHASPAAAVHEVPLGDLVDPSDICGLDETGGCRILLRSAPTDDAVSRLAALGLDTSGAEVVLHPAGSSS